MERISERSDTQGLSARSLDTCEGECSINVSGDGAGTAGEGEEWGVHKLLHPVTKRYQDFIQHRQCAIIHRLPVEILSAIFVLVPETEAPPRCKEFVGKRDVQVIPRPTYQQPGQSPALLAGAVCKRWRDIILSMRPLWTDIRIDLLKSADGQCNMVQTWASRSRVLPLDITIFALSFIEDEAKCLKQFEPVFLALRSLVGRWNKVALYVQGCFCRALLDDLHGTSSINTLFVNRVFEWHQKKVRLAPLRPKHLVCSDFFGPIPFAWDRLVFLDVGYISKGEILHIIGHAQNLQHCTAVETNKCEHRDFPIPTNTTTSHSLIYLQTDSDILQYLTLPSLQNLNHTPFHWNGNERFNDLAQFVNRSQAPLHGLRLKWEIYQDGLFPPFERLPEITSLSLVIASDRTVGDFLHALTRSSPPPILPHLHTLSLELDDMSPSEWSMFICLFKNNINTPDIEDNPVVLRQFSGATVRLRNHCAMMDEETFLHLVDVKKSGVDLNLKFADYHDFYEHMAFIYGVKP